jgi:hypothetical protein
MIATALVFVILIFYIGYHGLQSFLVFEDGNKNDPQNNSESL